MKAFFQVQSTFSSRSWEEHHETWKEHRYTWLPSWQDIPKHLHEALSSPHLSKLKVSQQNWWWWRMFGSGHANVHMRETEACLSTAASPKSKRARPHCLRPPNARNAHPRPIVACNLDTRRRYGTWLEEQTEPNQKSTLKKIQIMFLTGNCDLK